MKKRMGRPPKAEGESKSLYLQVRIEPDEKEQFYAAAGAAGMRFSEWARKILRDASSNEPKRKVKK